MREYYVENIQRGRVGNCLLFWRKGGHGYSCNLAEAEVFPEGSPLLESLAEDKEKYRVWPKEYLDGNTVTHVDHQRVNEELSGIGK